MALKVKSPMPLRDNIVEWQAALPNVERKLNGIPDWVKRIIKANVFHNGIEVNGINTLNA